MNIKVGDTITADLTPGVQALSVGESVTDQVQDMEVDDGDRESATHSQASRASSHASTPPSEDELLKTSDCYHI
ncbi:hypothetical protein BGZ99_010125 [Dissophora globulifera]|uniref:Uncharacterized protein n=1 Tax=Dissophora globulifera TaxID=979702 RepID=A0A9P6R2T6_9FUNG|nr:hypothetical protein BGZ99_010125 [Dissophora globulifera]